MAAIRGPKNGGAAIGYQVRKRARTTMALFVAHNQGQPLARATPQAGNHHDSYHLCKLFTELCALLDAANIPRNNLSIKAVSAFGTQKFCQAYAECDIAVNIARNRRAADWQTGDDTFFDPELYRRRIVVEHANA